MKSSALRTLALAVLTVFTSGTLAACNPHLYQQSVAPPGRSARLDQVTGFWGNVKHYRLEVSDGVALALTCNHGGPCEKLTVTSENPAVAEVRPASLSALQPVGYGHTPQPASAFVVVGKAPGSTRLRVTAKEGNRTVLVTVVPSPASALLVGQGQRAQNDANQDHER